VLKRFWELPVAYWEGRIARYEQEECAVPIESLPEPIQPLPSQPPAAARVAGRPAKRAHKA